MIRPLDNLAHPDLLVPGSGSLLMMKTRSWLLLLSCALLCGGAPATHAALLLNEILADNTRGILDGFGNLEDWIEIRNTSDQPAPLNGYHLTDDPEQLTKWRFPAVSVPANGFLLERNSGGVALKIQCRG